MMTVLYILINKNKMEKVKDVLCLHTFFPGPWVHGCEVVGVNGMFQVWLQWLSVEVNRDPLYPMDLG